MTKIVDVKTLLRIRKKKRELVCVPRSFNFDMRLESISAGLEGGGPRPVRLPGTSRHLSFVQQTRNMNADFPPPAESTHATNEKIGVVPVLVPRCRREAKI